MAKNLTFIFLIVFVTSCNYSSSKDYKDSPTYEVTKMSMEEQEKLNPVSFLSTDGTYRKNLLGKWVLEGTISNSATIATYKDVVLNVHFYSKTKTHLGTEKHVIYEFFLAGKAKSFKIKTMGYKGASTVGWDIKSASAN